MMVITGIAIAIAKAMAIVGAGLVGFGLAIVGIAILATPIGGWQVVNKEGEITTTTALGLIIAAAAGSLAAIVVLGAIS